MKQDDPRQPLRSSDYLATRSIVALAATVAVLFLSGRALLYASELSAEERCTARRAAIREHLLSFAAGHNGALPADREELTALSRSERFSLVCPLMDGRGAVSTYQVLGLGSERGPHTARATACVVCTRHAEAETSLDQPYLITTWDGRVFRLPRRLAKSLRLYPKSLFGTSATARFEVRR